MSKYAREELVVETRRVLLGLVLLGATLSGCSQGGPAAPDNEPTAGAGVTFADLEAAALAAKECMKALGLEVIDVRYDDSITTYGFEWIEGTLKQEESVDQCIDEHYEPTNFLWQQAHASQKESSGREYHENIMKCLRENGVEIYEISSEINDKIDEQRPGLRRECRIKVLDAERARRNAGG